MQTILVPLDGSDFAQQALPVAVELATRARAELILLQAIAPTLEAYPHIPLPSGVQDALRGRAQQELDTLTDTLRHEAMPTMPVVTIGHVAEAIVDEAARRQADLIVMATHGHSGMKRWAIGSVADKVLHATAAPLILVHARAQAREP
jgi:nucleotide-binding universal stress UspA family protein